MTTDIAVNGTIASVLPGDVHRVNETTSSDMVSFIAISVVISKRDHFKYH
jgi:quercetin dioxygenase-like cupin family protein